MDQFDDIPDFLWLTKEQRAASWRGRKLTTVHSKSARKDSFDLPCTIDAAGRVLAKQLQREKEHRARELLVALRARKVKA